jgi:hypothetical protein
MRIPYTLRLSEDELAALKRAAAADKRETAALARIIITEWLEAKGYLKEEPRR